MIKPSSALDQDDWATSRVTYSNTVIKAPAEPQAWNFLPTIHVLVNIMTLLYFTYLRTSVLAESSLRNRPSVSRSRHMSLMARAVFPVSFLECTKTST